MTQNLWKKVQGDINDTIVVRLGGVQDLTGATFVGETWLGNGDTVELDAEVTDADAREITVDLGDADGWLSDAAVGRWLIQYEGTFGDGSKITWPDGTPDVIEVRAEH